MRKTNAIILLACFLIALCGYQLFFGIQLWKASIEMHQALKAGKLPGLVTTLKFDRTAYTSLDWEEEGDEFSYKEKMYDVISITQTKDSVTIRCIADENEDRILAVFSKTTKRQEDPNNSEIIKLMAMPFLVSTPYQSFPEPGQSKIERKGNRSALLSSCYFEIHPPPPRA